MKRILWATVGLLVLLGLSALPALPQWNAPVFVDQTGDVGFQASLEEEDTGERHISYYDRTNGDLKYAHWDGMLWDIIEVVDSAGWVGKYTSLALDAAGNVHISYYDSTNEDLKYAHNTMGPWTIEVVDTTGDAGRYTAIAIDTSGNPHIVYQQSSTFMSRVLLHRWNEGGWNTELVDDNGGTGWTGAYNSITIGADNNIHVSYNNQSAGYLQYAYRTDRWTIDTVDVSAEGVGEFSSIALDGGGSPGVSYLHRVSVMPSDYELRYAHLNGTWAYQTVDTRDLCGWYTSLAYNLAGEPLISYYGFDTDDLRFAWDSAGTWLLETVDSGGDVGWWTSIAADTVGCPRIAYYDVTNGALKFADRDCSGSAPRHDGSVFAIVNPPDTVDLSDLVPVQATVENLGNIGDSIRVTASIPATGYLAVADTFLGVGLQATVDFPDWATPPIERLCTLWVWTTVVGDANPLNDTLWKAIQARIGIAESDLHGEGRVLWLGSGSPNPGFGRTTISYQIPARDRLHLAVYSVDGSLVRTLKDGIEDAGMGSVDWDGRDGSGEPLSTGVYICRLVYREQVLSRSLILLQ